MTTWIQGQYPIFSVTVNHQYGFSVSHTHFHHIWWSEGTRDLPKNDITISHLDKSSIWSVYNDPHQSLYSGDVGILISSGVETQSWMTGDDGEVCRPPETHLVLVLIAATLLLPKLRAREEQSRETLQPLHTSSLSSDGSHVHTTRIIISTSPISDITFSSVFNRGKTNN